jgi:hypothetical protein
LESLAIICCRDVNIISLLRPSDEEEVALEEATTSLFTFEGAVLDTGAACDEDDESVVGVEGARMAFKASAGVVG